MKRLTLFVCIVCPVPGALDAQLSRLVLLEDLAKEEGVIEVSSAHGYLGTVVARAGDVDGDGLDDVLIANGALSLMGAVPASSEVIILFGQAGLPAKLDPIAEGARASVLVTGPFDSWSIELGGGADVNGDGVDDFLIGEKDVTTLVFGSRSLPARFDVRDVGSRVPGVRIPFPRAARYDYENFQETASLGVDVNGDGIGEILLGDPRWSPEEPQKGRAIVIFGSHALPPEIDLGQVGAAVPGLVVEGLVADAGGPRSGDGVGKCVRTVGDVDGDGLADLGISGNTCEAGSYLLFGSTSFPDHLVVVEIPGDRGVYFEGSGGCMQAAGDVDHDGHAEFTLDSALDRYTLFVVGGRERNGFPPAMGFDGLARDPRNTVVRQTGADGYCPVGLPIDAGVDLDGDGRGDLVFARDGAQIHLPDSPPSDYNGLVYFLPLTADLPRELTLRDVRERWGFHILGRKDDLLGNGWLFKVEGLLPPRSSLVGILSDFDGDGAKDLLIGSPRLGRPGTPSYCYIVPVQALLDPALELESLSPSSGLLRGGDLVKVSGRGLVPGTRFFFGALEAEPVVSVDRQTTGKAFLRVPAWGGGPTTVDVAAARGNRTSVLRGAFRYSDVRAVDVADVAAGLVPGGEFFTDTRYPFGQPPLLEGLEAVRDVNADGIDDLLVWFDDYGVTSSIVFGGPHLAGRLDFRKTSHAITLPTPLSLQDVVDDNGMGPLVGSGDVDGDGTGDMAIVTFSREKNWLHVLYGGPNLPDNTHPADFPRRTRIAGRDSGWCRIVEDLDGGGNADLINLAYDPAMPSCGGWGGSNFGIWVLHGEDLRDIRDADWDAVPKRLVRTKFQRIETFLSLDANGDGRRDLAFQAKACSREGLLVLFGGEPFAGTGEFVVDDAFLDGGRRGLAYAGRPYPEEWPSFGFVLANAGDVDGDGGDDIVVGSPWIDGPAEDGSLRAAGEAYLLGSRQGLAPPPDSDHIRGWADEFHVTPCCLADPRAPRPGILALAGASADHQVGHAVCGVGDLNGDGVPDFAVGEGLIEPGDCPVRCGGGPTYGPPYTFVVFGERRLLDGATAPLSPEAPTHGIVIRGAGYHLAGGRDLSGDGYPDLVAGRRSAHAYVLFGGPHAGAIHFRRGDVDLNGRLEISDAVRLLGYLFLGEEAPRCLDAGDVGDDGLLEISDAIALLGFLFLGGAPPGVPFPEPGVDPTPDDLGCGG